MSELTPLKRALLAVEQLEDELAEAKAREHEPIAIVGIGCRYPGGADDPEAFFQMLSQKRSGVVPVPPDRWDRAAAYSPDPEAPGRIATLEGGFLAEIDRFDPAAFEIAPREVPHLDPQQRLLLEVAHEAFENAGIDLLRLRGSRTGVFVGILNSEYAWLQVQDPRGIDVYTGTGTSTSVAAGRLSYVFDLHGPSVAIDTACSSSLMAIHLACQSLRKRECDLALAGGVSLMLSPLSLMPFTKMHVLSPSGRCRTFDASADGFAAGEGSGAVVLKRLSDVGEDDRVYALVRGSAVNQDGRTAALSAPNPDAQRDVIRAALDDAGLGAPEVSFVETHGTATPLGDAIELEALGAVFGASGCRVGLGAVKTQFGHTGGAAGVAGVIKVGLMLERRVLLPNLGFSRPQDALAQHRTLFVPTEVEPWTSEGPRRAGVSAFGWSGTNAHVILEEAPSAPVKAEHAGPPSGPQLFVFSARTAPALARLAETHAGRSVAESPAALARSLARFRTPFRERLAVAAHSHQELAEVLAAFAAGRVDARLHASRAPGSGRRKVAFVFAPHGSEWLGMARRLIDRAPVFADTLRAWDQAVREEAGWSVIDALGESSAGAFLARIDRLQPALVGYQIALATLLESFGLSPDSVVGHSMGEIAAACFAGALSMREAAAIICRRTSLLARVEGEGAMGFVELSLADTRQALLPYSGRLHIAASNAPRSTVISGDPDALEALFDGLMERGIFCGLGVAQVAGHSPEILALVPELVEALGALEPRATRVPLISSVSGAACPGERLDRAYWARHLTEPVLFFDAVSSLAASGHSVFVELGPHPLLSASIQEALTTLGVDGVTLPTVRRDSDEERELLLAVGAAWTHGASVDLARLFSAPSPRVELPLHPWARTRYWLPPAQERGATTSGSRTAPLILGRVDAAGQAQEIFELDLDPRGAPRLGAHQIGDKAILSGSAVAELMLEALSAGALSAGAKPGSLIDLELVRPIHLLEPAPRAQISIDGDAIELFVKEGSAWHLASRARASTAAEPEPSLDLRAIRERLPEQEAQEALYARFAAEGASYGEPLRIIERIAFGSKEALAELSDSRPEVGAAVGLGPADAALQALVWLLLSSGERSATLVKIERVELCSKARPVLAHARIRQAEALAGDARLLAEDGSTVLRLEGVRFARIDAARRQSAERDFLYRLEWCKAEPPRAATPVAAEWTLISEGGPLAREIERQLAGAGVLARFCTAGAFTAGGGSAHRGGVILLPGEARDAGSEAARALSVMRTLTARGEATPLFIFTKAARATDLAGASASGAVWGLGRVLAEEHHEIFGALIDLDPSAGVEEDASRVRSELAGGAEGFAAWRGGERRVLRAHVLDGHETPARPPRLARDRTYLVTGGLGDIGLEAARYLITRGARHLLLVSRTGLGPRAAWRTPRDERDRRRIQKVLALETAGASVEIREVDIGDRAALTAMMEAWRSDLRPPIGGVLHTAGVIVDRMIAKMTDADLSLVLRPKLDGTIHLAELLAPEPLQFFVCFSSLGALLGGPGQGNYAAANAGLDHLALSLRSTGKPYSVINWGFWEGLGFANTPGGRRTVAHLGQRGLLAFSPEEAFVLLDRALASGHGQLAAMKLDLDRWLASGDPVPPLFDRLIAERPAPEPRGVTIRQRLVEAEPRERRAILEQHLRAVLGRVLRADTESLERTQPLGGLGIDSFMALELRNRLEASLGLVLSATMVFNHPTLGALADHLLERIGGEAGAVESAPIPAAEPDSELVSLLRAAGAVLPEEGAS